MAERRWWPRLGLTLVLAAATGCSSGGSGPESETPTMEAPSDEEDGDVGDVGNNGDERDEPPAPPPSDGAELADVTAVSATGEAGSYTFAVTIRSPDTGCSQYADWWEVVSLDGRLIARRPLAHSHVDEQPFTRSAGSIDLAPEDLVIVRAHMSPGGYGGAALRGSVAAGFEAAEVAADFAVELADAEPQPPECAF